MTGALLEETRTVRRSSGGAAAVSSVAILGSSGNETNLEIVARWRTLGIGSSLAGPQDLPRARGVVLARLDVVQTLDGVEPGLLALFLAERRGVRVLNRSAAMVGVHDKLLTAKRLAEAGVPHPRTVWIRDVQARTELVPPLVLKPRFGSWGRDVLLCRDHVELRRSMAAIGRRPWFHRHGTLLQELVPSHGADIRLVVAGGEVVGAAERSAAPGEWRTNVSLGGSLRPFVPPPRACAIAAEAAAAVGADLVGVDLIAVERGGYVVLELNGAVEFDDDYSLPGHDVYREAARALGLFELDSQ